MKPRRHCLLALSLVVGVSAAQAQPTNPCAAEGAAASGSMPCHPAAGLQPQAERRAADLPWPDGLAFGMRQAEVQALVPAAVPPRRDGDWAVLAEDRMAVQVLAAMVAGQEGMGGRSRLVEPVTVAGLALDAHHHFVMNRLTVVLAMPTQGWMAHEQAMAAHASLGQWLTARHGQPRVVQAPGRGRRVQVAHSEWSLPDGRTVVLVVLPGGGGRSLLALGLRL